MYDQRQKQLGLPIVGGTDQARCAQEVHAGATRSNSPTRGLSRRIQRAGHVARSRFHTLPIQCHTVARAEYSAKSLARIVLASRRNCDAEGCSSPSQCRQRDSRNRPGSLANVEPAPSTSSRRRDDASINIFPFVLTTRAVSMFPRAPRARFGRGRVLRWCSNPPFGAFSPRATHASPSSSDALSHMTLLHRIKTSPSAW